jgi:hypothetical protein
MTTPISTLLPTRLITLQSFKESVWGTPGAATAKWMGVQPTPTFKPYLHPEIFDEQRASLAPAFLSAITKEGGEFSLNMHLTYEDILFMLEGGLQGGVGATGGAGSSVSASPSISHSPSMSASVSSSPSVSVSTSASPSASLSASPSSSPSGTPGYVYTYDFAGGTTAPWAVQSYTLEFGYNFGAIRAMGCTVQKWGIKAEATKNWEGSLSGFYKMHNQNWTITAGLVDRQVEAILHGTTQLFMDPAAGTVGTTPYGGTMVSFALEVDNGIKPIWTGDLMPTTFTYEKAQPTLTLQLLYTSAVKSFLTNYWFNNSSSLIRLKSVGSPGKSAQIDFSGVLADDPTLYGSKDGAQILEVKLAGFYDPGFFANYLKARVQNYVSAVP